MRFGTMIVSTKRISSDVPRETFSEEELTRFAEMVVILEGGNTKPMVIRETAPYSRKYVVVSGHFSYWVAVRAREIDPDRADMSAVFVPAAQHEAGSTPEEKAAQEAALFKMADMFKEREANWKFGVESARDVDDIKTVMQNVGLVKNDVPANTARKWERLAKKAGLSVSEWIISQLPR